MRMGKSVKFHTWELPSQDADMFVHTGNDEYIHVHDHTNDWTIWHAVRASGFVHIQSILQGSPYEIPNGTRANGMDRMIPPLIRKGKPVARHAGKDYFRYAPPELEERAHFVYQVVDEFIARPVDDQVHVLLDALLFNVEPL